MAMEEPKFEIPPRRRWGIYLYSTLFIIITGGTTVTLSIWGFISFDPLTALVAGLIAGFAFVMFQMTYIRFVANSSQKMHKKEDDIL
ncbi:MAG: hypothetical protein ACFFFK_08320 [Candidatus Thorarchaeota archaeon]